MNDKRDHRYGSWNSDPYESQYDDERNLRERQWDQSTEWHRGPEDQWRDPRYRSSRQRAFGDQGARGYRQYDQGDTGLRSDNPDYAQESFLRQYPEERRASMPIDPRRQNRERNFGATGAGTNWGGGDTSRHQLGSLTDSAASSARQFSDSHRYRGGWQGQGTVGTWSTDAPDYSGRGPRGYQRGDDRVREDVCEALTRSYDVDASEIDVSVKDGVVTLAGTVEDRRTKRAAEEVAEDVSGVKDVQNQLSVVSRSQPSVTASDDLKNKSILGLEKQSAK